MNEEDQDFLESLKKDFIEESYDLLLKCEECLLSYEQEKTEVIFQEYMRIIHSLKGSARAVEFDSIASTLHLIESLGQKSRDQSFIDDSLKSLDGIKEALSLAKNKNYPEMEALLDGISLKLKSS
jgi:chemotaxis protein histidine kinase CheA